MSKYKQGNVLGFFSKKYAKEKCLKETEYKLQRTQKERRILKPMKLLGMNSVRKKKEKPQRESVSSPYMFSILFISLFGKLVRGTHRQNTFPRDF